MKKFLLALLLVSIIAAPSTASKVVPGDVLVVFKNPYKDVKVSAASMASGSSSDSDSIGQHRAYITSAAESLSAKVSVTYNTLSEKTDSIMALLHSDTKSEQELLEELRSRPDVKGASLNYIRTVHATPNDRYYGKLWGMSAVNAEKVWDAGYTGSDTVYAAVIDTGIASTHSDLEDNIAKEYCRVYRRGTDKNGETVIVYSDNEDNYQDDAEVGHGTHVAGTIAAIGNNSIGVAGVNWNAKLITFKVNLPDSPRSIDEACVIAALQRIYELKNSGVNIAAVNISFGGWQGGEGADPETLSQETNPYWSTLKTVSDAGILICVSAGNEGQRVGYPALYDDPDESFKKGDYVYPASYRNIDNMIVTAAAGLDESGNIVRSVAEADTNYGSEYVDLAAPGAVIASTVPSDYIFDKSDPEYVESGVKGYAYFSGSSMASPHTAGAAVLLKSIFPDAAASDIKKALLEGANGNYCKNDKVTYTDDYEHADDSTSRYGLLDIKAAYDILADKYEPAAPQNPGRTLGSSGGSGGCSSGLGGIAALGLAAIVSVFMKRR